MLDQLISNSACQPTFDEITNAMDPPARGLWLDLHTFIHEKYRVTPKTAFSTCAGKPGWNLKYKKSGKSLCTLYPEQSCFTALVVVKVEMGPLLLAAENELHPRVFDLIREARPYIGTYWLMIPVVDQGTLESVKKLLVMKSDFR